MVKFHISNQLRDQQNYILLFEKLLHIFELGRSQKRMLIFESPKGKLKMYDKFPAVFSWCENIWEFRSLSYFTDWGSILLDSRYS